MQYGFRARNAAGQIEVDITDELPRIVRTFVSGTYDGNVSVPELSGRRSFFFVEGVSSDFTTLYAPDVIISGTTVSWSFSNQGQTARRSVKVSVFVLG